MTGLFERAVGEGWENLHPRVRDRYGLVAADGHEAVGIGRMRSLESHPLAGPALRLGTVDDFLFPEGGTDVPFEIVTESFVDDAGFEALHLRRRFRTDPPRTFVDTLRWDPDRGRVVDLFGRRGLVAAELCIREVDGHLALSIGPQWLRVGGRYPRIPDLVSAGGRLRDYYDEAAARFRVAAEITSPLLGTVFRYDGVFESAFRPARGSERATESALSGVPLPGEVA